MRRSTAPRRSNVRRPSSNSTKSQRLPIGGGLDVVTPMVDVKPGRALTIANYEPYFNYGYRRCQGFERTDGRPKPHLQTFVGFTLDTVSGLVAGTTMLTGDTSGESGLVVDFDTDTLSVALTKLSGDITDGESFNSGTYTMTNTAIIGQAPTDDLEKQYRLATEDEYRSDITEIPGTNDARGGWRRGSYVYGIRDNVGETAAVLHLQSSSGWTTSGITMADYQFFDAGGGGGGNALPEEGDTVTGGTSGATATVHRIILHSGAPASNDAAGYLVLTSVSGGPFQNNEDLEVSATVVASADGANTTFAFPVGGVYQFKNHNFYAGSDTYRTYGVNGVGPGFEIDENNIVSPILMPQTALNNQPASNTPYLIEEHRNYLFIALPGGIFQHSSPGEPLTFNGFLGAAEFGMGEEITGMNSVVGGVLSITTERGSRGLYGKDTNDWELKSVSEKSGGLLYSAKVLDYVYSLNNLGVTSTERSDKFGDFVGSTVSQLVQPIVNAIRNSFTDSTVVRELNQYRMYFNDGSCLVMYVPSTTAVNEYRADTQTRTRVHFGYLLYPIPVVNIYSTEDENNDEVTYFVSTDGYLYEDRVGRNFDGASIESYIRMVYNNINSPTIVKRIYRGFLEMEASDIVDLTVYYDFDYADANASAGQLTIIGGGGVFDDSLFDNVRFDTQLRSSEKIDIDGSGENIAFIFYHNTATNEPFTLQGLNMHYSTRRLRR